MTVELALSRKTVRHFIVRRRNERIAEHRDASMPTRLSLSQQSLNGLLSDGDPNERWTLDFEGFEFMGIPIAVDDGLGPGVVAVDWP